MTDFFHLSRLRWACRRGMLELDVLLGNFLENAWPTLAEADKKNFIALLEYSDPQLFAWLLNREKPEDSEISTIVDKIQQHAKSNI